MEMGLDSKKIWFIDFLGSKDGFQIIDVQIKL